MTSFTKKKSNARGGKQLCFSNGRKLFMQGKVFSWFTEKKSPHFFICVVVKVSFQNGFG
jgi:hypothetical protein